MATSSAFRVSVIEEFEHLLEQVNHLDDSDHLAPHMAMLERAQRLAAVVRCGPFALARIRLQLARACKQSCRFERGYELALEAFCSFDRLGDIPGAARAGLTCASICIDTCDYPRAMEHTRRALERARACGDRALELRLLANRAIAFCSVEEFEAAVACAEEAAAIGTDCEDLGELRDAAAALLSSMRTYHADALTAQGQDAQADAVRALARAHLPAVSAHSSFRLLNLAVHSLSRLGDMPRARIAAAHYMRRCRAIPRGHVWWSYVDMTMATYQFAAGRLDKAAATMARSVEKMREAGRLNHVLLGLRQLAAIHAAKGDHARALALLRQARAERERGHSEQLRLLCRMESAQRQVEARLGERRSELHHAERLAVIGRLMAQICHSLQTPLLAVRDGLETCVTGSQSLSDSELSQVLASLVANVGDAARLARQLKMFSYRSAPQQMAINLSSALREAWIGIREPGSSMAETFILQDAGVPEVRGDAQRLAVLLRILLIEIERTDGHPRPRLALRHGKGRVVVEFDTTCEQGAGALSSRVGFRLCEEIAREMRGALNCLPGPANRLRIALELPAEP